jgi:anti-sigma B factor antagonist
MELSTEQVGAVMVVEFRGEYLDASVAEDFKRDIGPALDASPRVVLDLNQLQFVDSSGIGAILSCQRRLAAVGGDMKLCAVSPPVRGAFEITRMHRLFEIHPTREEAIGSFGS